MKNLTLNYITIIKTNQEVTKGYNIRVSQDSTTESWCIYYLYFMIGIYLKFEI